MDLSYLFGKKYPNIEDLKSDISKLIKTPDPKIITYKNAEVIQFLCRWGKIAIEVKTSILADGEVQIKTAGQF